jgi:hypothetical protein
VELAAVECVVQCGASATLKTKALRCAKELRFGLSNACFAAGEWRWRPPWSIRRSCLGREGCERQHASGMLTQGGQEGRPAPLAHDSIGFPPASR